MESAEYKSVSAWFDAYVDGYRGADGLLPGPLELKRVHSLKVAENAARIGEGLSLRKDRTLLASAAGLLHDTGRFTQYARYASFIDADSLDHGLEGRGVLEREAAGFFKDKTEFSRLLCSVQYHNRKTEDIPPGLSSSGESLLRLVRDADKLDIMEILAGSVEADGFQGLPALLPGIRLSRELSPGVLEAAAAGENLSLKKLRTLGDVMAMAASWYYDLNYTPSLVLAEDRHYLARLRRQLPEATGISDLFKKLSKEAGRERPGYKEEE